MSWDIYSKLLLKECPQDFVTFFAPGARYVGMRETHLQTRADSPFDSREMRGDGMIEAEERGEHFLVSTEFQTIADAKMDERLLGYSYEATRLHNMNVLSAVFYLRSVGKVTQPPLKRRVPNGFRSLWFNYKSIDLARTPVQKLRRQNLDGLQPLLILCQGGNTLTTLDEVVRRLQARGKTELLGLASDFAGLVFTSENEKAWLRRRFAMLRDPLREYLRAHSWTYQETIEEGYREAIRQGIEAIIQARFPNLLAFAQSQIAQQQDLARLRQILIVAGTAHVAEEVEQSLYTDQ